MDADVPVDAQNAPTATWKTAQTAVSHSAHTPFFLYKENEQRRERINSLQLSTRSDQAQPGTWTPTSRVRQTPMTNTNKGTDFENYVASLYTLLGFTTSQDVLLSGQQVDVVAEKVVPGMGLTILAIECKFLTSGTVSNGVVHQSLTFVESSRAKGEITQGVLVSNRRFSRTAKEAAKGSTALVLLTVEELEDELFALTDVYSRFVADYEARRIYTSYVSAACVRAPLHSAQQRETLDDAETYLVTSINERSHRLITVLGDFGTGKTTLLERLKYRYARAYVNGEKSTLPLFVSLKEFHRYSDLDALLARSVRREFQRDIPTHLFWKGVDNGRFLLLLDGFDEMTSQVTSVGRAQQLLELGRALSARSPAILSCRPTYFVTRDEYEAAVAPLVAAAAPMRQPSPLSNARPSHSFRRASYNTLRRRLSRHFVEPPAPHLILDGGVDTIELSAFDEMRIRTFLAKHETALRTATGGKHGAEAVYDFLITVYDLRDLMSRPILLDMILETVLEGVIDIDAMQIQIGPTSLYELNTDMHFERDWSKGPTRQQVLTREQRREFAEAMAVAMFNEGALHTDYENIRSLVDARWAGDLGSTLARASADEVAGDVRLCTFLSRTDDGHFRFAHKSFMEYFVARHIKERLRDVDEPLTQRFLPKEILYFLGGFAFLEPTIVDAFRARLKAGNDALNDSGYERRNMATALLYSGPVQWDLQVNEWEVTHSDVRRVRFERGTFSRSTFREVLFSDVSFVRTHFASPVLRACTWTGVTLMETNGRIVFSDSSASRMSIQGAVLTAHSEHATAEKLTSSQSEMIFTGDWTLTHMETNADSVMLRTSHSSVEHWKASRCRIEVASNDITIRGLSCVQCDILIKSNTRFDTAQIGRGSVTLEDTAGAATTVWLQSSSFVGVSIDCLTSVRRWSVVYESVTFDACTLCGVPIDDVMLRKRRGVTVNASCQGFMVVDGSVTGSERIQGSRLGRIGNVLLVTRDRVHDSIEAVDELVARLADNGCATVSARLTEWRKGGRKRQARH